MTQGRTRIDPNPETKYTFIGKSGGRVDGETLADVLARKAEADSKPRPKKLTYTNNV